MIHYIASFIVYTLAMIGLLIIAYVVYKKTALQNNFFNKKSVISIEDMLKLPDRKTLYIINCLGERYLIASSGECVNLISKLDYKKKKDIEGIERYLEEKKEEELIQSMTKEENEPNNEILVSLLKELSDKNKTKRGNY